MKIKSPKQEQKSKKKKKPKKKEEKPMSLIGFIYKLQGI